jgi:ADP-ribose pyrophosphatase YjhB (NUDIX family)
MSLQKSAYVDVNPVIVTDGRKIVLARRRLGIVGGGMWHLPGGRVWFKETILDTLKRVSFAKTNIEVDLFYPDLKESLVGIYDDPLRDPREHVMSLAFLCKIKSGKIKSGENVDSVGSFSEEQIGDLEIAFDHRETAKDAFATIRNLSNFALTGENLDR